MLINVPVPGQTLGNSRPSINTNFSVIDSAFSVNMVPYNAVGAGKHNFSEYVLQAADPALAAGEIAVYNKTYAFNGTNELFIEKQVDGSVTPITASNKATNGAGINAQGWSRIASGLLLKWGFVFVPGGPGVQIINFPTQDNALVAIPAFATCFGCVISLATGGNPNAILSIQGVTATQMSIYNSSAAPQNATFWSIGLSV